MKSSHFDLYYLYSNTIQQKGWQNCVAPLAGAWIEIFLYYKKTVGMFIPLLRNGQEKMVSVSVVGEDRIIYISSDMFKLYEQGLSEPDGIRLKKSFI